MPNPIYLNSPLELRASKEGSLPEKVSGVAYTGAELTGGWEGRFIIDLESVRVADDMPLLNAHNREDDIGAIGSHENDGSRLSVSGSLFSSIPGSSAEQIALKSKLGAKYQMSIGVTDYNVERIKDGKTVSVNGRELMGPVSVYRDGFIREVSIVTLGWDADTSASILKQQGDEQMNIEELKAQYDDLSDELGSVKTKLAAAEAARDDAQAQAVNLTAERDAALAEVVALKAEARKADVAATLAAVGIEVDEDKMKPYLEMSVEAWDGVKQGLSMAKPAARPADNPNLPDGLFKTMGEPTGDGDGVVAQLDMNKIYDARKV